MTTAVSVPDVPDVATAAQWRRLSPRMLLVHPVIELGRAIPALIGVFVAGTSSGGGSIWGVVAAAVVIALALLRWFTTRFRITPEQIQLRHGLVRRITVAAPLDRVRTVDVSAHALHRVLGLAKVVIRTGTSDRKRGGGLVLDGLPAPAAARLREELLHQHAPQAAPAAVPDTEEELVRVQPGWIRYAPFTLSGAITSLALLGFGWRLDTEAHVNLTRFGPLRAVGELLRRTSVLVDAVAVTVVVLAVAALASTIGYVLAFWRFRLTRHEGGSLQVTRGLVTTRATSIERRRLRGVELSEPLLLRAVGGARCLAIATGLRVGRGAERGGEVLLPPAPRGVALSVAGAVLGDRGPLVLPLHPHPRAALRRRLVRSLGGTGTVVLIVGVLVLLTGLSRSTWFVSLALPVLAVPLGVDRYRSLGHGLADGYLVARLGSVVRRRSVVACEGIIGWNFTSSFFQRRAGLTTLTATTAAGRQGYEIVDLARSDAMRLADEAVPGLLAEFAS